jgi:LysM repeat protein
MTYTVQAGDSLSLIAQKFYGDLMRWGEIYDANKDLIGDNPDAIEIGMQLQIPGIYGPAPDQGGATNPDWGNQTINMPPATVYPQTGPSYGTQIIPGPSGIMGWFTDPKNLMMVAAVTVGGIFLFNKMGKRRAA